MTFSSVCNGERRQTWLYVCDSLKVTTSKTIKTNKKNKMVKTWIIDGIMDKQSGASHWSVSRIKVSELE